MVCFFAPPRAAWGLVGFVTLACAGCGGSGSSAETGFGTSTSGPAETGTTIGTTETTSGEETSSDDGIKLDIAPPDPNPPDKIPETCAEAQQAETTVGCEFFAIDLDRISGGKPWALAISNVQLADGPTATVSIERKTGAVWNQIDSVVVPADDLDLVFPPTMNGTGPQVALGGALRLTSDVPIIVYQISPYEGGEFTADASMLYPVPSLDDRAHVIGWQSDPGGAHVYATAVATADGTQLEITPSITTRSGPGLPAIAAGMTQTVSLDEGDFVELVPEGNGPGTTLTGTVITSDEDHPFALFTGHYCTFIPLDVSACDHLEEQLAGIGLWGTEFVASRLPIRFPVQPESMLWQVYASQDDTTVTIEADPDVTGLPNTPATLAAGEMLEFYAGGTPDSPGDFRVAADQPIAVVGYMTGGSNMPYPPKWGDPAVVQLSPVEQFLNRYVVLVPPGWAYDRLVISRPAGAEVRLDGAAISDHEFTPVGADYEVARVGVSDGIHRLDGDDGFSVIVVGYQVHDSYAYLGGVGTSVINPEG